MKKMHARYVILAAYVVIGGYTVAWVAHPVRTYDVWWHLATGRYIVDHGAVPHHDIYSYTRAGQPWIAHEWAWEVLLYEAFRLGRYTGMFLLRALVIVGTVLLLTWICFRRGAPELAVMAALLVAVFAAGPVLNDRPQIVDFLFLSAILALTVLADEGRARWLWLAPALMVFWVNLHGGFAFGIGLLGLYAISLLPTWLRQRRLSQQLAPAPVMIVGVLALTAAACLLNPRGLTGALYPLQYVTGGTAWAEKVVTEYRSPDFGGDFIGLLVFLLLMMVSLGRSRRRLTFFEVLTLLVFLALGLRFGRNGGMTAFMLAPIFAVQLGEVLRDAGYVSLRRSNATPVPYLAAAGLMVALAAVSVPHFLPKTKAHFDADLPCEALRTARALNLRGNVFNTYEWGGYFIWKMWPQHKVFVDGRADVMGKDLVDDYFRANDLSQGWRAVLDRYHVQWLVIRKTSPLCRGLELDPGFTRVPLKAGVAALFIRNRGVNGAVAARLHRAAAAARR